MSLELTVQNNHAWSMIESELQTSRQFVKAANERVCLLNRYNILATNVLIKSLVSSLQDEILVLKAAKILNDSCQHAEKKVFH